MNDNERTIHFVSLGCVKNRVDTEVMLGVAQNEGFRVVDDAESAQVIVVNTCGFIGEAKKESIETIFELAELKRQGACEKLVVTGCLSQRYSADMAREMGEVDHFLGSSDMLKLGEVLRGTKERILVGNPAEWVIHANDPRVLTQSRASAYLKLAEGCNRTCSFCVIPQLRGKQRSRTANDVVDEAKRLAQSGVVELNLISQDTIAYGRELSVNDNPSLAHPGERTRLAEIVERIASVDGIRWVRLFYLYPETIDEGLIDLLANHPRVVPYVDMPLQHASDAMLKRMRRGHGKDRQRRVVERLRTAIPNLAFRTAFIVGHPGETDQEFNELCEFVEWAQFEHVGVFRYSDEETCQSFGFEGKVSALVASNRYRKLMAIQRKIARKKNASLIGKELDVLVEGGSEEHEFVMKGRHAGQAPEIDGQVYLSGGEVHAGEIRRVRVSQASDYDLVGEVIGEGAGEKKPRVSLKVIGAEPTRSWQ